MLFLRCLVVLLSAVGAFVDGDGSTNETAISEEFTESKELVVYRNLFKVKRKEHIAAVQKLLLNDNISKRARLINIMLGAIVETIGGAMEKLKLHDVSREDFPTDPDIRDALSQVLENTALFTDLMVRFPKISHAIYRKNTKRWKADMRKAIDICHQSPVYEGDYQLLLHNLQQELGIGAVDETYKNPFIIDPDQIHEETSEERKRLYQEAKRQKKLQDKKQKKKKLNSKNQTKSKKNKQKRKTEL